ncbi:MULTISPECIES: TetR/AcrR family transcriptional regulator [unclassified Streptomyces]|uniref:TetR/AcrR family transcriptional regulator n=1 Tax=unclassified Streptomyces TaxID=2593676 RepID=UPI002253927C|nr:MULTISPECIES: TetR/AcrR family transcriptional regulator [unclassified Streptomyces]MCX4408372.1 TetR/AcrR family transcriptional regulator [Streptomyces sp. NBC_01764]MCX5186088.1 TetR/AcrR family transcriptional regulator [Streptomyces sp. NBC_00268]
MAGRRTDTRQRAQRVALRLFAEYGYEGTSLRMIAEGLNITKAALYYHYKSKEEILAAVLADFSGAVADLIEWGKQQPSGPETRRELLRRYGEWTVDGVTAAARLIQVNEPALREQPLAAEVQAQIITLFDLLAGPGVLTGADGPVAALRVKLAISALHLAGEEAESGGRDVMDAALDIACGLLDPQWAGSAP